MPSRNKLNLPTEVMRPVTLYVSKVQTSGITMDHAIKQRITSMDIEVTIEDAKVLAMYLQERIEEGGSAGIRVRLEGHLLHG